MTGTAKKVACLTSNHLKLIGALAMVLDHMGVIFFPQLLIFRILGRLAFPIFAYLIVEGCRYTSHKLRYFLRMAGLATVCQVGYGVYSGDWRELNVLVTFSIAILLIYILQWLANSFLFGGRVIECVLSTALLALALVGVVLLDEWVDLDYGAVGCILPLFAALPYAFLKTGKQAKWQSLLLFGVGLALLSLADGGVQPACLAVLPLLALYSGERGKWRSKYFFYVFYPVHLLVLQGVALLVA